MKVDLKSKIKIYCFYLLGIISLFFLLFYFYIDINTHIDINIILIWVCFWIFILIIFLYKFLSKTDILYLLPFIIAGLTIRLVIAIFFRVKFASNNGLITPDEFAYFNYAKQIVEVWKSGYFMGLLDIEHYVGSRNFGYDIWNALHFLILKDKLLPVISNIFIDICSSVLVYKFSYKHFGGRVAKLAFLFFIFNPHLIYWSTFLLKDTLLTFLIILFTYEFYNFITYNSFFYIMLMIPSFIFIVSLRFYLAFVFIIIILITLLFNKFSINNILIIIILIVAIFSYPPLKTTLNALKGKGLQNVLHFYMTRSLLITHERNYSTKLITGYNIKSLIISISHFLLAPSPFNLQKDGKYLVWGTVFWYFLLPYYLIGTILFFKEKELRLNYTILYSFPLCITLIMVLLPAINEPRHRVMIYPFASILASYGMTQKFRYKQLIIFAIWLWIIIAVLGREVLFS